VFKKYLLFNLCFITIFLVELSQTRFLSFFPPVFVKPLFTGLAALMLVIETRLRGRFHRRMLVALISFLIGTVLLAMKSDMQPMYVLLFFFIAAIYLVRAFYLDFSSAPELDKFGARVAILLGLLFSFSSYLYLRPYLGEYKMAGLMYSFLIALVMMMASFRRLRVDQNSFILILSAAIVLAATALIFAVNYFIAQSAPNKIAIDSAYMLAIYLFLVGAIERKLTAIA
jgi:hypothetical protein